MSANAVAANEGPVAISFEQTWADVLEVNRTLPKMRWAGWMMGIVGGGIIVTGFVVLARGTLSAAPLFLWGSVFMLIGMLSGRVAAWGVWWREENARLPAEISDNGMRWWTEDVDKSLRMSWDEFDHVYETDRLIVIHRGLTSRAVMIPKRALTDDGQAARLRAILRRQVKHTPWRELPVTSPATARP